MEDWNGFISGGMILGEVEEGEVVAEWRPDEPLSKQYVLCLNSYTKSESAFYNQLLAVNSYTYIYIYIGA